MKQTRFKLTNIWGSLKLEHVSGPEITPNIVVIGDRWVPFKPASRGSVSGGHGDPMLPAVVGLEVLIDGTKMFVHAEELEFGEIDEGALGRLLRSNSVREPERDAEAAATDAFEASGHSEHHDCAYDDGFHKGVAWAEGAPEPDASVDDSSGASKIGFQHTGPPGIWTAEGTP